MPLSISIYLSLSYNPSNKIAEISILPLPHAPIRRTVSENGPAALTTTVPSTLNRSPVNASATSTPTTLGGGGDGGPSPSCIPSASFAAPELDAADAAVASVFFRVKEKEDVGAGAGGGAVSKPVTRVWLRTVAPAMAAVHARATLYLSMSMNYA